MACFLLITKCTRNNLFLNGAKKYSLNFRTPEFPFSKCFCQFRSKTFSDRLIKTAKKCFQRLSASSGKLLLGNGKIFGSILSGYLLITSRTFIVLCDSKSSHHTRIVGTINSIEKLHQEAKFDWKKFYYIMKSEVWYILCAVVSALVVAFLNIRIPVALGDMVNVVTSFIRDDSVDKDSLAFFSELRGPAIHLLYMYLAQSLFTFAYISILSVSGERVARNMRKELFTSVIEQDIAFFDAHKTGEISSRLTNDVQEFKSCYKLCISQGLRSVAQENHCRLLAVLCHCILYHLR